MTARQLADRILSRLQRQPRGREAEAIVAAVYEAERDLRVVECRTCGGDAAVQLVPNDGSDRYEFFCEDDLCTFLFAFADPRVREWTVVKL